MSTPNDPHFPHAGIGQRLRDAREVAGLSVSEVGQKLKMPARVVSSLEAEDWDRLGAPVFVRGQLRSYARLLGLPVDLMLQTPEMVPVTATELKPRTYTPKMQRFAEQSARRAVYAVLTLALLVPVWVATRPQSDAITAPGAPLDLASESSHAQGVPPAASQPAPMRASLAPIPTRTPSAALTLKFEGESWVAIEGADGEMIESGLLKAGDERSYAAGQVARMKLGNASVVRVQHEGQIQDLTPYLRSNVARFTVSSDGSLAPPAE